QLAEAPQTRLLVHAQGHVQALLAVLQLGLDLAARAAVLTASTGQPPALGGGLGRLDLTVFTGALAARFVLALQAPQFPFVHDTLQKKVRFPTTLILSGLVPVVNRKFRHL